MDNYENVITRYVQVPNDNFQITTSLNTHYQLSSEEMEVKVPTEFMSFIVAIL